MSEETKCETFSIISQKWDGNNLSFTIKFKLSIKNVKSDDFYLLFHLDIANNDVEQIFKVPCKFRLEKGGNIILQCTNYSFDPNLSFDELTNFSAFIIVNDKIDFKLSIPTYCGSENGKDLTIELYAPI